MNAFQVGKTYRTRSACDSNCVIAVTIQARTAHTVKAGNKVFRVGLYEGVEFIRPWGNYSMAPIVRAADAPAPAATSAPVVQSFAALQVAA